jgi:2-keto-3-deoxy-L-fuconate dehydrogenase
MHKDEAYADRWAGAGSPSAQRWRPGSRWGRPVTADEVAAATQYLASPAADSTTGTGLVVDGGMSSLRVRPRS